MAAVSQAQITVQFQPVEIPVENTNSSLEPNNPKLIITRSGNLTTQKINEIFTSQRIYHLCRTLEISKAKIVFTAPLESLERKNVTRVCRAVSAFWEAKHLINITAQTRAEEKEPIDWLMDEIYQKLDLKKAKKLTSATARLEAAQTETGITVTWEIP